MKRIILHWTGGNNTAGMIDRNAYHYIITGSAEVVEGEFSVDDNIDISDRYYAAHTKDLNTGSIGVSLAGMHGATEHPFQTGDYPINKRQVEAMVVLVAQLCRTHNIPVTGRTVLTHAEVERVLKVRQRPKWDITWLPGMTRPGDAVLVGDALRERIRLKMTGVKSPRTRRKLQWPAFTWSGGFQWA